MATSTGGNGKGQIPARFLDGVMRGGTQTLSKYLRTVDNQAGRPTPLLIIPGIGRFDAQCDDVDPTVGTQTTRTSINFTASVKQGVNVSRLLGRDIGAGERPAVFSAPKGQPVSILASADGLFELIMEAKGRSVLITGASRTDNGPGPEGRLPDLGHRLQGRLSSSARSTSATRSGASSIPALKRMKPSPTASLPQRARRSALECRPPKLVACRHQLAGVQEGVGAGVRADVEADDRADARPAHVADVVAGAQRRRRARGRWPPGARGAGPSVASERCASHASNGPGIEPVAIRHARSASARCVVGHGDGAHDQVAVAGEVLGGAHHRVVRAELERALAQRARERVVDGDDARRRRAPRRSARGRSSTSSPGLEGDSSHTSVAPGSAARTASSSVGTSRTSTPLGSSTSRAMARMPG